MESNSSPRYVSSGRCVSDRFPSLGNDGYVGHCKTEEDAKAECVWRNSLWTKEVAEKALEGRVWMPIPQRPTHHFFGVPAKKYTSYCD